MKERREGEGGGGGREGEGQERKREVITENSERNCISTYHTGIINTSINTSHNFSMCSNATCLKAFPDSLEAVSTVNSVEKMLHSLAP